jgi:hypothetical protein
MLGENSGEFEDVKFGVGSKQEEIEAIRLILISSSPISEQMLSSPWFIYKNKNKNPDESIQLRDIQPKIFKLFLISCYNTRVDQVDAKYLKDSNYNQEGCFVHSQEVFGVGCCQGLRGFPEDSNDDPQCFLHLYTNLQPMDEAELQTETFKFIIH